jgi:class 3 adenylate cyclase
MKDLPSGVLTFLFTDVEGSTRLASHLGDARWGELLATHREILRSVFEAHGREALGADEARTERDLGRAMSVEEALAFALDPITS